MKRNIQMGVSIGGPTIIMIFVVLCLTTLGTLSLVTANAELKLSEKTTLKTINYYDADCLGEAFLAKVDALLTTPSSASISAEYISSEVVVPIATTSPLTDSSFDDKTLDAINSIENTQASKNADGSLSIIHSIDMDQDQKLVITLHVPQNLATDQDRYAIKSWKIVNKNTWIYEDFETQFDDTMVPFDETIVQ